MKSPSPSGKHRATDPIRPLKVYKNKNVIMQKDQPVIYYLAGETDTPQCGFSREELLIVLPDTETPPSFNFQNIVLQNIALQAYYL